MNINVKTLKSILTLSDYEKIEKALGLKEFSRNKNQVIFYNADKYKDFSLQSPKLYFYPNNKIYISYTKNASYDIIGLIQAVKNTQGEKYSFIDAINFILSVTGIDSSACERLTQKNIYEWENDLSKYLRIKQGEIILQNYETNILDSLPTIYPQSWINEGISIESMEKYGIKYYPRLQSTVIPCYDKNGNLIGIRNRHWLPEEIENGKYRPLQLLNGTIYKFPTNKVLFGLNYNWAEIERTSTVMIVESEKAVMKLDTWYNEKNVAVGMFGNNLGLTQRKELLKLGVKRVIYIVDNDWKEKDKNFLEEWYKEINKFIDLWKGYATVEIVWDNLNLLNPKENAVDQTKEIWKKLYDNREIFN